MKSLLMCILVGITFSSCGGHTIDSTTYRKLKSTTDDFLRIYSDMYKDDTWGNENFGRIYHPGFYREGKLESKLKESKIKVNVVDGLKLYREVSRKDIIYSKSDDSYLIRNDFKVIAVLKEDRLSITNPEETVSQYYWLQKDKEDNNLYKIIDVYPTIMTDEFIYYKTFIENYKDYTKNESIKREVEAIKVKE